MFVGFCCIVVHIKQNVTVCIGLNDTDCRQIAALDRDISRCQNGRRRDVFQYRILLTAVTDPVDRHITRYGMPCLTPDREVSCIKIAIDNTTAHSGNQKRIDCFFSRSEPVCSGIAAINSEQ